MELHKMDEDKSISPGTFKGTHGKPISKFAMLRSKGFVNQATQNHCEGDVAVNKLEYPQSIKKACKTSDNIPGIDIPRSSDALASNMLRKIWLGFGKPQQKSRLERLTCRTHLNAIVEVSEEEEEAAMMLDHLVVEKKGGKRRILIRLRKFFRRLFKPDKMN